MCAGAQRSAATARPRHAAPHAAARTSTSRTTASLLLRHHQQQPCLCQLRRRAAAVAARAAIDGGSGTPSDHSTAAGRRRRRQASAAAGDTSSSSSSSSSNGVVPQQQQQQQAPGVIPPQDEWGRELRHLQGLLSDPTKPLVAAFVLAQCYTLNTPATRAWFRQLSAADMSTLLTERQQLERRLSAAAHALSVAWRRLQLLSEAVCEQGTVLSEEQLNKEREAVVDIRDRLVKAQALQSRSAARARECRDGAYVLRAARLGLLLHGFSSTAEGYLKTSLRGITAASKVNAAFSQAWVATPHAQRPHPAAAEAQRQAQLQPLLPLLPEAPTKLLADYRQAALAFQLHRDRTLHQRPPGMGQPSTAGGTFWQSALAAAAAAPEAAAAAALAPAAGEQQPLAALPRQQQLQLQPPLRTREAAWQQPPQLLARPPQSLPLLPHLTRPWVRQQTLLFRAQLEQGQQLGGGDAVQQQSGTSGQAGARLVLPPLPVMMQRAAEIEGELLLHQQQQLEP